jgi:hypothetical protein
MAATCSALTKPAFSAEAEIGLTALAPRIDTDKSGITADSVVGAMATFVYSCPTAGFPMQASAAEKITEDKDRYEPIPVSGVGSISTL